MSYVAVSVSSGAFRRPNPKSLARIVRSHQPSRWNRANGGLWLHPRMFTARPSRPGDLQQIPALRVSSRGEGGIIRRCLQTAAWPSGLVQPRSMKREIFSSRRFQPASSGWHIPMITDRFREANTYVWTDAREFDLGLPGLTMLVPGTARMPMPDADYRIAVRGARRLHGSLWNQLRLVHVLESTHSRAITTTWRPTKRFRFAYRQTSRLSSNRAKVLARQSVVGGIHGTCGPQRSSGG